MSRVGKNPVNSPAGVTTQLDGDKFVVKGPLGQLDLQVHAKVRLAVEAGVIQVSPADESTEANALSGTVRALIANMVVGVTKGFEKRLSLVGVGYKAQAQGDVLNLALGFSHPINHKLPSGVKAETPTPTEIILKGIEKQQVGQVAAVVRGYRPPEPYKGKGVRYVDEVIVIKETKKK
ncbi:MAG: 50S ribosomal protein L6 [Burkholderiaceae bacterium]|jgi:large subunit ribosomal protein L6